MRTYNGKVETSLWHCTIGICTGCHYYGCRRGEACMKQLIKDAYQAHLSDERDLDNQLRKIKEQKVEIDILIRKKESLRDEISDLKAEVERLNIEKKALLITVENMRKEIRRLQVVLVNFMDEIYEWGNKNNVDTNSFAQIAILGAERDKVVKEIKSEAIKEFAEQVNEVFLRYAHIHTYADQSMRDSIEAIDGTEIEMQSVWDVLTLKKYDLVEYEEMNELQTNIETIAKDRLLTELEKDFSLLLKEMTVNYKSSKTEE